jgi:hypothetical protein
MRKVSMGKNLYLCLSLYLMFFEFREPQIPSTRIPLLAAIAGSMVTRTTSRIAFRKAGRGLVTEDMLSDIGGAFSECFGAEAFWGEAGHPKARN